MDFGLLLCYGTGTRTVSVVFEATAQGGCYLLEVNVLHGCYYKSNDFSGLLVVPAKEI